MEKASRRLSLGLLLQLGIGLSLFQGCIGAHVEVEPREALVLPRQNVTFLCRVAVPLQYCRVELPGGGGKNLGPNIPSDGKVKYSGAGLDSGQCGFVIDNVDERHNGEVKCTLGIKTDGEESVGKMQLIVARPPKPPVLELSRGPDNLRVYKIYDTLQASCMVNDGRPVANISWFLDEEPIHEGLGMPIVVDLARENLQSKSQNLTRQLRASDNGKQLRCIALHPALPNGMRQSSVQLDVEYAPQPMKDPMEHFGYQIGQPGIISLIIESNPKPKIEWAIAGQIIREGASDNTGRIEAQPAKDLGRGRFEVNLRMAAVNKEDTEKEYILIAQNLIGRQTYNMRISTSPEPEGLELGLGSIIGIVVAICVLILVVFLLIFAKTTGRWCFSGPRERQLGESSDTESADDRPKDSKRNLIPIKLTQYFRRSKNNNEPMQNEEEETRTEEQEDPTKVPLDTTLATEVENVNENKESGVVYAELDLKNSGVKAVVKNDNDKTEYAEIIYAPKGAEQKTDKQ